MNHINSFAIHTLGCKLNFSESSTLVALLKKEGMTYKTFDDEADLYVINTCSVTENADKECKQIVKKIHTQAPDAFIIITGCYAQLKPKEIAEIQGVDMVLGAAEKFNLINHIKTLSKHAKTQIHSCEIEKVSEFVSAFSFQNRTRSFLKIQDGCDYTCSYCTIPLARGKSRSDTTQNILTNIQQLHHNGVKEIVLTGVNVGDFKNEQKDKDSFYNLLINIENNTDIQRIRISSIEPNLLTEDIIDFVANSKKIMPHFHIPLQSGSDKILGLMQRRYKTKLYQQKIEYINKKMPHAGIGVDVIVGFPNETETDFNDTYQFLHHLDVSYLHVFTYSERPNTKAIDINNAIPMAIRKERNHTLRNLSLKKTHYFKTKFINTMRPVLFEQINDGIIEGYTDNYIKIQTQGNQNLINQIQNWLID